jgi:hypothetical protein
VLEPPAVAPIATKRSRWTGKAGYRLAVGALVVLAAVIYRPWQPTPLPISDWGGMLPILTGEPTVAGRFHGLMDAFTRDGRYQPAVMAAIAATWSVFGADTVAWQWIRFVVMTGIILACIVLARRLGASAIAAAAAALLVVVAGMAQQSWLLLQLAEPRGTLVLVCAALLAVGYGASERWAARAFAIVALLVLSILYKETFIVAVPFVLALALWARKDGRWAVRTPTKRDLVLIAAAIIAIGVFNAVPVLGVRKLAAASAYTTRYDISSISVSKLRNVLSALFLPVTRVWWFPANAAFLTAIVVGVALGVRRHGRPALMSVGVLLSLLLLGVATYLPWFAVEGYYALAFLPALVSLFALALTWLWESRAKTAQALAVVSCGLVGLYGVVVAYNHMNAYRALRAVEERTALALSGLEGRTLIAAVPSPATSGGFANGLRGYAAALGITRVPHGTDVACNEAAGLVMQGAPVIVVVFSTFCGSETVPGVAPARVIRQFYIARDWKTFTASRHEVSVRIWATAPSARGIAERGTRDVQQSREDFSRRL